MDESIPLASDGLTASSDTGSSPPSSHLSWLSHSQHDSNHILSVDGDQKPLSRQRRRRTSPEDQKILEEEYQRNPKPDKAARMEIVEKVALGEKEVQIWFQNRRQNTRRKTRPLLAHEIIPHLRSSFSDSTMYSRSDLHTNDDATRRSANSQFEGDDEQARVANTMQAKTHARSSATSKAELAPKQDAEATTADLTRPKSPANEESQTTVLSSQQSNLSFDTSPVISSSSQASSSSLERSEKPTAGLGYLANRRSASFKDVDAKAVIPSAASQVIQQLQPLRTLSRSRSGIRLSMTADGKAKVITDEDESLFPNLPESEVEVDSHTSLRRSFSSVDSSELGTMNATISGLSSNKLRRSLSGRSRDSRAWEFWCDSHSRNSLAEKAEQESSGSAADAIGLIRANSSRIALRQNPNKRNAQTTTRTTTAKRVKTSSAGKSDRPQLKRVASSYGRLQSRPAVADIGSEKELKQDIEVLELPQTESDKENWEPSGQSGLRGRVASPAHSGKRVARKVLGESSTIPSLTRDFNDTIQGPAQSKPHSDGLKSSEPSSPDETQDVAKFTGASGRNSTRTSVSSGEDLDCIEGLLKLRQGNWR